MQRKVDGASRAVARILNRPADRLDA